MKSAHTTMLLLVAFLLNFAGSALGFVEIGAKEQRPVLEDPTGLLNEGMRYRCLETGVFLTRDPAGFIDGPNVYTYVRQNPWSKFDPLGLYEDDWQRMDDEKELYGADTHEQLNAIQAKSSAKTLNLAADFTPIVGPIKGALETVREVSENGLTRGVALGALADQVLKRVGLKGKGSEVVAALSTKSAKQTKKQAQELTKKASDIKGAGLGLTGVAMYGDFSDFVHSQVNCIRAQGVSESAIRTYSMNSSEILDSMVAGLGGSR